MGPQKRQLGFRCMLMWRPRPMNGKSCNNANGPVAGRLATTAPTVGAFGKHACSVDTQLGDQGGEPGNEVQGLGVQIKTIGSCEVIDSGTRCCGGYLLV